MLEKSSSKQAKTWQKRSTVQCLIMKFKKKKTKIFESHKTSSKHLSLFKSNNSQSLACCHQIKLSLPSRHYQLLTQTLQHHSKVFDCRVDCAFGECFREHVGDVNVSAFRHFPCANCHICARCNVRCVTCPSHFVHLQRFSLRCARVSRCSTKVSFIQSLTFPSCGVCECVFFANKHLSMSARKRNGESNCRWRFTWKAVGSVQQFEMLFLVFRPFFSFAAVVATAKWLFLGPKAATAAFCRSKHVPAAHSLAIYGAIQSTEITF